MFAQRLEHAPGIGPADPMALREAGNGSDADMPGLPGRRRKPPQVANPGTDGTAPDLEELRIVAPEIPTGPVRKASSNLWTAPVGPRQARNRSPCPGSTERTAKSCSIMTSAAGPGRTPRSMPTACAQVVRGAGPPSPEAPNSSCRRCRPGGSPGPGRCSRRAQGRPRSCSRWPRLRTAERPSGPSAQGAGAAGPPAGEKVLHRCRSWRQKGCPGRAGGNSGGRTGSGQTNGSALDARTSAHGELRNLAECHLIVRVVSV